ncbi:recombinase RecA [bacterium M21]|nr:recombinase RecA [bacterium M21]
MARKARVNVEVGDNKDENIERTIAQLEREYGKGTVMRLGDDNRPKNIPTISTGALSLDLALGIGGVPRGRIVEIYGPESSGKTTVCSHVIANAQKAGGVCAFIDTEHALDPRYLEIIGVNTKDLLVSQPDCGEDALNIAEMLIRSNSLDVLVIDSVAALVPRAEIEGQMGDSHVGLQARLMSQALRKITGAVSRSKTCLIFTNQIREKIGVMFGNPETTAGGNALKFYASVRLDIRRIETLKSSTGDMIGNRCRVKVVKNKVAPPFQKAEFDIMYDEGISRSGSVLDCAINFGIIEKRGSWFSHGSDQLGQGREQAKQSIREDEELEQTLLKAIRKEAGFDGSDETEEETPEAVAETVES